MTGGVLLDGNGKDERARVEPEGDASEAAGLRHRRRATRKFPRPVRLAIITGVPVVLWAGMYLVARKFL